MPKHHKPDHDHAPTRRKSSSTHPLSAREERDAGRKLLLFAGAAIAVVLLGVWWLMRR